MSAAMPPQLGEASILGFTPLIGECIILAEGDSLSLAEEKIRLEYKPCRSAQMKNVSTRIPSVTNGSVARAAAHE